MGKEKGYNQRKDKKENVHRRISVKFNDNLEEIKDKRLRLGLDKNRISTRDLTDLIRRNVLWDRMKEDMINYDFKKESDLWEEDK